MKNRKQGNKKEKLTELLHTVEMTTNYNLSQKTLHKQNHCQNHKAALNKKPTDSPQWFVICSLILWPLSFEGKGNFAVYDKNYQNVWTQPSMPRMPSAEYMYQTTIPLKFLIIIHSYANV